MAYCLLGIFNVTMALFYGEENNAFRRLQEEILRSLGDLSIFAWKSASQPPSTTRQSFLCGVLAESICDFRDCGHFIRRDEDEPPKFSISNLGGTATTRAYSTRGNDSSGIVLPLDCIDRTGTGSHCCLDLRVKKLVANSI